jgi:protoporphyrinogen/coproporphyrinogen III oxidase
MARERVIVVGAGLAGLACALELGRAGVDVVVLEAGPRAGGCVASVAKDGFLFEEGPNTVPASARTFRRLCGELGIAERLVASDPAHAERWLFHRGALRALPRNLRELLATPMLSWRAKGELFSEPLRAWSAPPGPEPTFADFLEERIGREITQLFAGAFVRGVYAAEIDELGARSAFPKLWQLAERHKSLVRGAFAQAFVERERMPGPAVRATRLLGFPQGFQELVTALARALGERLKLRASVRSIERWNAAWIVRREDGTTAFADALVLAVPAPQALALLEPLHLPVRAALTIPHARVCVVGLGLPRPESFPRGFGYLVPPIDAGSPAPLALGTIFTSNLFAGRAPEGMCSVSSFYRGQDVETLDEGELVRRACDDLRLALKWNEHPRPRTHHVRRWEAVIPRYGPGHRERIDALERELRERAPGLWLAGSYTGGVSIEQVLARGLSVASRAAAHLRRDP